MFFRHVIFALLFASAWSGPALAGTLTVGATVVSHRPAVHAQADFPVPAQSRRLTTHDFGGSWYVPTSVDAAANFYRDQMAQRGYRVMVDDAGNDAVQLHWERDGESVEILLQPVLGETVGTRLVLSANAG